MHPKPAVRSSTALRPRHFLGPPPLRGQTAEIHSSSNTKPAENKTPAFNLVSVVKMSGAAQPPGTAPPGTAPSSTSASGTEAPGLPAELHQHRCHPRLADAVHAMMHLSGFQECGKRIVLLSQCLAAAPGSEPAEAYLLPPADQALKLKVLKQRQQAVPSDHAPK